MSHPVRSSFRTPPNPSRVRRALVASGVAVFAVAVAALASCGDSDSPTANDPTVLKGADVPFGAGTAHTELMVRGTSIVSLAVVMSETALDGLPATLPPMTSLEMILPMPAGSPTTVFDHVGVNWQPTGHPPVAVYTTPHFDVHFYMITQSQRDAIAPTDPQFGAKTARQPVADERPTGYTLDPSAIPRMGVHAGATEAPENHGAPFTTTFVYGFYDGGLIFLEPMLTRAYLLTRPDTLMKIATPARYARAGAYATSYAVRYDKSARQYRVELRDFVQRP